MRRHLLVGRRVRTAHGTPGDAVLIAGGLVSAVGRAEELRDDGVTEDRYPEGVILPAPADAHLHPIAMVTAARLDLSAVAGFEALEERLRQQDSELPPDQPIVGGGLDEERLSEGRLPHRDELDRMIERRPLLLYRVCGHTAVANGTALRLGGLAGATVDPPGGVIGRDGAGRLTGMLREGAVAPVAMALAARLPSVDPASLLTRLSSLAARGLSAVGAVVTPGAGAWCGTAADLDVLADVAADLPLDVHVLLATDDVQQLTAAARRLERTAPRLTFLGWKGFADGSLGARTAALHEAYSDAPDERGLLLLSPEKARPLAKAAIDLGGMVAMHAIGDRANDAVLDFFTGLLEEGADASLLRLEHASVLTEDAVERLGRLGIMASIQPAFVSSDAPWLERRLGRARMQDAYPFARLAAAGVPLAGGSDAPVESPDPWEGMAAACDRTGLLPHAPLDASAALALYTSGASAALRRREPLSPGSPADLVVADRDPVTAEAYRALDVLAVWRDGRPGGRPSSPDGTHHAGAAR